MHKIHNISEYKSIRITEHFIPFIDQQRRDDKKRRALARSYFVHLQCLCVCAYSETANFDCFVYFCFCLQTPKYENAKKNAAHTKRNNKTHFNQRSVVGWWADKHSDYISVFSEVSTTQNSYSLKRFFLSRKLLHFCLSSSTSSISAFFSCVPPVACLFCISLYLINSWIFSVANDRDFLTVCVSSLFWKNWQSTQALQRRLFAFQLKWKSV